MAQRLLVKCGGCQALVHGTVQGTYMVVTDDVQGRYVFLECPVRDCDAPTVVWQDARPDGEWFDPDRVYPPPEGSGDAQSLHARIAERCAVAFDSKQYDNAILNAFRTVEEEIRRRINGAPTDLGVNLVSKAMGGDSPPLKFSDVEPEQQGAHQLYRGAIAFLKNPQSHRRVGTDDRTLAYEALAFASLLMRLLDSVGGDD